MFKRILPALLILVAICGLAAAQTPLRIPANPNPNLYPADADAKKEIAEAIEQAGRENKRVLLVFGANWCGDCHALDYGFHRPSVQPLLDANFKVVHVDIGGHSAGLKNEDLATKYHVNLEKGIPSIAILDSKGVWLESTAAFESARSMTEEQVVQFLNSRKPPVSISHK